MADFELDRVAVDDPAALERVVSAARTALAPVMPDAVFRERLHQDLVVAARRARPSRATRWSAAVRRRPLRSLVRGGATVAVIGIAAAVLWRGRPGAQVAAGP